MFTSEDRKQKSEVKIQTLDPGSGAGMTILGEKVREWLKSNEWYNVGAKTNQYRLEQSFGQAIENIARQLDYHDKPKLRRQVLDCWDHLNAKCMKIDLICRAGCKNNVEMLELEFLRSKAVGAGCELAEVIELLNRSQEPEDRSQNQKNNPVDCHITFAQAAELLAVSKGTVSKWAAAGRFSDNGLTGQKRRLLKSSVLLVKQEMEEEELQNDIKELRYESKQFR